MDRKVFHYAKKSFQEPVVLIAGAAGFIGSYLCELLLLKNCRVIGVDNFLTGKKENLKNCFTNFNFTFIEHDLITPLSEVATVDYIFHLAGLEAYVEGKEVPLETLKVNAYGTVNLLKLAQKKGAKFLLGSSFRVYQAKISTSSLSDYFGEEKAEISFGSLAEAKRFAETLTSRYHQNGQVDARIVRLGFIYGPRMNLMVGGELASLLKDATQKGPLRVLGDGSQRVYPTFVSDVVYGLSKAMFSLGTGGKIFNLVNLERVTLLDFAQEIKNQRGKLSIEFFPKEEGERLLLSPEEIRENQDSLGWTAKVGIKEGIRQTQEYLKKEYPIESKIEVKKNQQRIKNKINFRRPSQFLNYFSIFLLFFVLLFSPVLLLGFDTFWGIKNLKGVQQALVETDFSRATKKARVSEHAFSRANRRIKTFSFIFYVLGQERTAGRLEKLFGVGERLAKTAIHASQAANQAARLAGVVFQEREGEIPLLLSTVKVELDSAYEELSFAETEAKTEKALLPIEVPFSEIRNLILKLRKGIEIVPVIIGLEGRRVYLVLLQNNMELRPTGGFIEAYALITFDQGELIDFEVEDVYAADDQLKGQVEPPAEIKEYLNENSWYLRDSNWSPDFPTAAIRAEWFFEKETGRKIDGVIGVDFFLGQNILEQIGPVELPEVQETVDDLNLFERAEYHSETDFLIDLTQALFEKVKTSQEKSWFSLAKAIYRSLEEKDLMFYLADSRMMETIVDLGWDGRVKKIDCDDQALACYLDYLMIIEANLGVNKVNYFIKRDLDYQVEIDQRGELNGALEIRYENQSQTEAFPAGRYKNYLRILVPEETELNEIIVGGERVDEEKIDQAEILAKKSFGFLVELPIEAEKTVRITYRLKEKVDLAEPIQYLFLLQKQPGIRDEVFNFSLTAPPGISFIGPKPAATQEGNKLIFKPQFNRDLVFEVGMTK